MAFVIVILIGCVSSGWAGDLGDPGFESLKDKTVSYPSAAGEWSIPPGPSYADGIEAKADASAVRNGTVGLSLKTLAQGRLAAVRQTVDLPTGIYEFKVWARGNGILTLMAGGLRRRGDLGKDWAEYSVAFEQKHSGPADLTIMAGRNIPWTLVSVQVDDASLSASSPERVAAWRKREQALAEYGFVPEYFSAQSPQPGSPVIPIGKFQAGPVDWREKVVYYDPKYDYQWIVHPETLAAYLGANGFLVLDAEALGAWMKKAVEDGAYGTVCVMTHGICPGSVYDDKVEESAIYRYLRAGGRVIWLGNIPFSFMQDAIRPQIIGTSIAIGYSHDVPEEMLSIRAGWDVPCWNNQGTPVLTGLGKSWGLNNPGGPTFGAYPEDITAALSGYYSDYAGSYLAVAYFKNFNPLYPWSGFIFSHMGVDFNDPANQQSVYRLALYAGKPVDAPAAVSSAQENAPLKVVLDAPRDRRNYYRGEVIPVKMEATGKTSAAGKITVGLERREKKYSVATIEFPTAGSPAVAQLATDELTCGEYRLKVISATADSRMCLWETVVSLCPRREDPTFFIACPFLEGNSLYRQEMMVKDVVGHGMSGIMATTEAPVTVIDLLMKYGLRFSMRAQGTPKLSGTEREQAERRGPNGEKMPGAWEGGRPMLGLLSTKQIETTALDMAGQVKELAGWPSAWPRCQTNDDFCLRYGWDYSDLAKRLFKEKTGLDAPVPPEIANQGIVWPGPGAIAREPGIVPDSDPWLQWNIFTTKDIGGGYNKALLAACSAAVPGIKVGPIPGSMMFPLWEQGQYPPHSFGPAGFNLIYYYTYLSYWQPTVAYLYWNEVGRMGNRDLELWALPNSSFLQSPGYYINIFFLQMAGGAQGLVYFSHGKYGQEGWKTLGKIGNEVVRPLYPFLGKLRPARTGVGLLLPYTQYCYRGLYPVSAVYPYANLLAAHVDIQPTCEEEVLSGDADRYKVILLWRVQYLRQSVVTALEKYIVKGGIVICDATTVVPIKGAIRSSVDLAMGEGKSTPDPNDPRLGGPGIRDYLHLDRVTLARQVVEPYVRPWADCGDPTLVVRRHEYRGVIYLWLVNIDSQEDYEYIRQRAPGLSEAYQLADPEKAGKELSGYFAERDGKPFAARVTIPAGSFAAYDALKGKRVPLEKEGDRLVFSAEMERLGGTLIALYPESVKRVTCDMAGRVARGRKAELRVKITGPSGQPLAGTQPLAVTVITPQGEWPEITGAHATEDGVWTATIFPAVNDPAGKWKIRVKELSSGIIGEVSFKVD